MRYQKGTIPRGGRRESSVHVADRALEGVRFRQLKETGQPVVLTINGKAELVVQDTASYQKLIELAERAERMDALKASFNGMKARKVIPADDLLAEMRQILDDKQGR